MDDNSEWMGMDVEWWSYGGILGEILNFATFKRRMCFSRGWEWFIIVISLVVNRLIMVDEWRIHTG